MREPARHVHELAALASGVLLALGSFALAEGTTVLSKSDRLAEPMVASQSGVLGIAILGLVIIVWVAACAYWLGRSESRWRARAERDDYPHQNLPRDFA